QYLERITLYRQPIWQCESSGRSNLTYAEALESERIEKDKVQNKLPVELQKAILKRAQFQNTRLDAVVEDVYSYFINRYLPVPNLEDQTSDDAKYKVQLVDEDFQAMDDYIDTVTRKDIKRDRLSFSKNLLKKFLRESLVKETYLGAPWTVNDQFAERFQIDTTLPEELETAKSLAYSKSRKMRSLAAAERRKELEMAGTTSSTEGSTTQRVPTEKSRMEQFRRLEIQLKYPMEDLDIPSYRRNPPLVNSTVVLDMSIGSGNENKEVPNPTGDLPPRPKATHETVATNYFGAFLMVWSFLNVFSRPLHLSPFTLDDFESALRCTSVDEKREMVYEVIVSLLNCIIRHRIKTGHHQSFSTLSLPGTIASTTGYPRALRLSSLLHPQHTTQDFSSDSSYSPENRAKKQQHPCLVRGVASEEVIAIGNGWDSKPITKGNDREGWEDVLIGCINDLAIELDEDMTVYDNILCSLVPRLNSSLKERGHAYLRLGLKDKLAILQLLVHAVNETSDIKDYIEECQEELTELRKQKIEVNRDRKHVTNTNEPTNSPTGQTEDSSDSGGDSDQDSANEENMQVDDKMKTNNQAAHVSRHETRQNILKRKQMEREQEEAKRKKLYHQQQQEARERNQELRARSAARKKLENEERLVQKKLDQVERDMRKYSTLRFKPLGRDRFYNRYYYLDNIGGSHAHGSGKLFVQSPSIADLSMLLTSSTTTTTTTTTTTDNTDSTISNKTTTEATTSLCGHGGGLHFICQLMKHQGLSDKATLLENEIDRMIGSDHLEWWESFDDPDALDGLLAWMNPKGVREYLLKRELQKHLPELMAGMKKHSSDQQASAVETTRRSTRTKTISHYTPGSWTSYTNKLAK
ncbi:hypothetical protein BC941DRAFT_347555, partial [Chlamydoabsidia padenii]